MCSKSGRPKHLALLNIRLPLPGWVSILHRLSGVVLFLALPALLYALDGSLSNPVAYALCQQFFAHPVGRLLTLGLLWAFLHHACAGVRFLFLDIHQGIALQAARRTAAAVLVFSLALTTMLGLVLWA